MFIFWVSFILGFFSLILEQIAKLAKKKIEHLIEKGIDLRENLTLLQTAVEEGHFEVLWFFI